MKTHLKNSLLLLSAAIITLAGCNKSELEGLKNEVGTLTDRVEALENTQIKALETQIASIEKEVAALQSADEVQSDAVSTLEGKVSVLSDELAKLKESVSSLGTTSDELSGKIDSINEKLSKMEAQIASILESLSELSDRVSEASVTLSYIPEYSDGSAGVQYTREGLKISGATTLKFAVLPARAAFKIARGWKTSLSADAVYTLTKAAGGESIELGISDVSAETGVLSVKLDPANLGKDFILGNFGVSLALKVSCGDIQIVSDYIPLFPVMNEKPLITYLLANFDTDGDGQVDKEFDADGDGKIDGMDKATELNISGYGFTSIDDIISEMPALQVLDCSDNNLTSIDLSNNTALTEIDCSGNNLTSIDFRNNLSLVSVDLGDNADLKKIIWKKRDYLLKCRYSNLDIRVCYWIYKAGADIMHRKIDFYDANPSNTSLVTVIDGMTWNQFNVGVSEGNVHGSPKNFSAAESACPTGWRLPTLEEVKSLGAHHSEYTTYLGAKGYWYSGSQEYSTTVPAIFLPVRSAGSNRGGCWSSTVINGTTGVGIVFDVDCMYIGGSIVFTEEFPVRCVKNS